MVYLTASFSLQYLQNKTNLNLSIVDKVDLDTVDIALLKHIGNDMTKKSKMY